jgi:hypothetical protein
MVITSVFSVPLWGIKNLSKNSARRHREHKGCTEALKSEYQPTPMRCEPKRCQII